MKKLVKVIAAVTMVTTMFTSTASAVKMYSPDGRTASVMESDVAAWKAKGWSTKNYKTMYAPDGRTAKVLLPDVKSWKKVGWYEVPVTTVYAPDGRTQVIAKSDVEAWVKVGWSENSKNKEKKITDATYKKLRDFLVGKKNSNPDSRFCIGFVNSDSIPDIFLAEGDSHASGVEIYLGNENGVNKVITEDGFESFGQWGTDVEYVPYENKIKSYYSQNGKAFDTFYSIKGNVAYEKCELSSRDWEEKTYYINGTSVSESKYNSKMKEVNGGDYIKIPSYENLYDISESIIETVLKGNSSEKSKISKVTMYAPDGRTASVAKSDVEAWKKVGWYDMPVTTMYSSVNGKTMVVANSEIEAYRKVGWQLFHEHFIGKTYNYIKNYFGGVRSVYWFTGEMYEFYLTDLTFGFKYTTCSKIHAPLLEMYTGLSNVALNGRVSKVSFERYINKKTVLNLESVELGSCLEYEDNSCLIFVECDDNGWIDLNTSLVEICKPEF